MRCLVCGSEEFQIESFEDREDVLAYICQGCGEAYMDSEQMGALRNQSD